MVNVFKNKQLKLRHKSRHRSNIFEPLLKRTKEETKVYSLSKELTTSYTFTNEVWLLTCRGNLDDPVRDILLCCIFDMKVSQNGKPLLFQMDITPQK